MKPVDYESDEVPGDYACFRCHLTGCKLWRQYQTLVERSPLLCASCACELEKMSDSVDSDGQIIGRNGRTDLIGWTVPAIPTEDGRSFHGYASIPEHAYLWWRSLPTRISN